MTDTANHQPEYEPVKMSDEARIALAHNIRKWSGLAAARLEFGAPVVSPFAEFDRANSRFVANPERLVLNPNRVYLTVTPFRLRQEAVMTGALLHEASHARHTLWTPSTPDELPGGANALTHGPSHENAPVSKQTLALAKLMEEPRIEGIMAAEADTIGAFGLGWTMRASAAHLIPGTTLSTDPDQRIMDIITSWALRAGRQLSLAAHTTYTLPTWVGDFTNLLHQELSRHFTEALASAVASGSASDVLAPQTASLAVVRGLTSMATADYLADTTTFMVDTARDVLEILFPETDGDEDGAPMPGDPMHSEEDEDTGDEDSEGEEIETPDQSADSGEGEPSEDGTQEDQSGADSADQGEGEGQDPDEGDGPAEPGSEGQPGEGEGEGDEQHEQTAAALADLESEADDKTVDEGEAKASEAPPTEMKEVTGAGNGGVGSKGDGWREPTPEERTTAKGAEMFLRNLINPSETSRIMLSESPSASVDGAAMAEWKAGGQRTDPRFFRRTKRQVTPAPPVKIAILADVSESMMVLQKPSAMLSWALASAALDLRNFAGRGVQVESTLIHWGVTARVIQGNGATMQGIKEFDCIEGTDAMGEALSLVEQQMPGFFTVPAKPEHRLLVQFTDWELWGGEDARGVQPYIDRALAAGVNMLSVVPKGYTNRRSCHDKIIARAPIQRGRAVVQKYEMFTTPADVWAAATTLLQ